MMLAITCFNHKTNAIGKILNYKTFKIEKIVIAKEILKVLKTLLFI